MSEIEQVLVTSVPEFFAEVVPRLGFHRTPIYRGHASSNSPILPSLVREPLDKTEFLSWNELEGALLIQFKQEGAAQLSHEPMSELEWMALGQQYGLPTRLTAWTQNALVALYFASQKTPHGEDGVVWRLLPTTSELVIAHDHETVPNQPRLYTPAKKTTEMLAQSSCYLTHPIPSGNMPAQSLETYFQSGFDTSFLLTQIIVPDMWKESIRNELARVQIDVHRLFPGIYSLCRRISQDTYFHSDSYEWMLPTE